MSLPASLEHLLQPGAFPHPCTTIELIETHISWVLLTGEFAYKLKKPVKFSFLDFSTLEKREHFCREELRCNRAFAPELYEAVVAVCREENGRVFIAESPSDEHEVIEYAVQMRQFDPSAQLDRLIEHDKVTVELLRAFGQSLAETHARLPRKQRAAAELDERILGPVEDNFTEIAGTGLGEQYADLVSATRALSDTLGEALRPLLETRLDAGFLRECHGDLHLSNLVLIDNKVVAFDCLEFNANLRWIDTLNDVAFLFMDCSERGRDDLAYAFLNGYLDTSGDYAGVELLGFFAAYRSVVRAKVAALRFEQSPSRDVEQRFLRHLEWARDRLARSPGKLFLMCGLSGSGKSYQAQNISTELPAVHLRSDVARKTRAGLGALDDSDSGVGEGLYAQDKSDDVYAFLADTATRITLRGEHVIVDATFLTRARRDDFRQVANAAGLDTSVLYCSAPVEVLEERIRKRAEAADDPSEATLDVLASQLNTFEPPEADEDTTELSTGV